MSLRHRSAFRAALLATWLTVAIGGKSTAQEFGPSPLVALPMVLQPPANERSSPAGMPGAVPAPVPKPALPPSSPPPATATPPANSLAPWWGEDAKRSLGDPRRALFVELDRAVLQALLHSAHVRVLRDTAAIADLAVPKAEANFDPMVFADSRMTDTSDPVGNTLTTGGAPRFIDQTWYGSGGVKRKALTGAELEAAQRTGWQNNNSLYFVPTEQATARITVSVSQPLLRGAGQEYNRSVIVLAQIDSKVAHDAFCKELQTYLLDFHRTYWDLYLQRAALIQRKRLLADAKSILAELEARREVDVIGSQLARARAAVASREAATVRFEAGMKNAAARFKSVVNDPFLDNGGFEELIPLESPETLTAEASLKESLATALDMRPEIRQATHELNAASVRWKVSKQDLLPLFNAVLGGYSSGLQGQSAFGDAYANQFDMGRPTYWGGFTFEMPLGNRAAKAVNRQRSLEVSRAGANLQAAAANVRAEVEIAVRELEATFREMTSEHAAMQAELNENEYLFERWRVAPDDRQAAGVVFNNLLDAQERKAETELDFARAVVAHRLAWAALKRATGTLCDCTAVSPEELNVARRGNEGNAARR